MIRSNLGRTIVIGIAIFTLAFGEISLLSFSDTDQLQQNILFVEAADDVRELTAETELEEKNNARHHASSRFTLNRSLVAQAARFLDSLTASITPPYLSTRWMTVCLLGGLSP